MSYFLAPALVQLRNEVNSRWPNRSTISDGWIGDAAHSARRSDHNPDWGAKGGSYGVVRALDVTTKGIDVDLLLKHTTNDSRVSYVIYNRRIYQHSNGWQPYTGSNPHTNHVHISIRHDYAREQDTKLWFGSAPDGPGNVSSSSSSGSSSSSSGSSNSVSVVDYLRSKGQDSSYSAREKLASQYGISNYQGTTSQNIELLKKLQSGSSKSSSSSSKSSSGSTSSSKPPTNSIVDYLNSKGRNSSFAARRTLANRHGIKNYSGAASQNTQLLNKVWASDNKSSSSRRSSYTGGSIVEYLKSIGRDSSFATRRKLAAQNGIKNYRGTAAQNTQLLNKLRG